MIGLVIGFVALTVIFTLPLPWEHHHNLSVLMIYNIGVLSAGVSRSATKWAARRRRAQC